MKRKKLLKKVEKHKNEQLFARCTFDYPLNIKIVRGYIIDYSKKLILFQESDDSFMIEPYGFKVLPLKSLIELRYNRNDKFYDFVTKSENEGQIFTKNDNIPLNNWQSIFKYCQDSDKIVIVEHAAKDGRSIFTIGKIVKIKEKRVEILHFDATGKWDVLPTSIKYKDLYLVNFDDRYSKVFSKYLS